MTVLCCLAFIENPDISTEELIKHIPGPDFPTGGIINGRSGILSAYETGKGKVKIRAKVDIVGEDEGKTQISIENSSGSWDNIVTLENGEFQLEKLELDFSHSPEVYNTLTLSLSDPNSDDIYHQSNDVFYYFYELINLNI